VAGRMRPLGFSNRDPDWAQQPARRRYKTMATRRLGIVVGGGPAPGINAVIGAATIQAINCGFEVVGFFDGFRHLCSDEFDPPTHTVRLEIARVARIHFEGGSILRTARTNLLDPAALKSGKRAQPHAEKVSLTLGRLRELGINYLLTIGGDDTALSARFISEAGGGRLRVVHVPKTIDNDLPLPQNQPTFGFSTARMIGAQLLKNLMMDSQTTGRWYLISAMGRSAGWLAMSIGQAAGATVTLIPEEFEERSSVQSIVDVLAGASLKRSVFGRCDGVAVIAEGLAYRLGDRAEIERLLGREVPLDAAGHMRLSEVPLLELLKRELQGRFKARGEALALITHNIGYELRSAAPTPHDMAYCRALGYHSIRLFSDPSVHRRDGDDGQRQPDHGRLQRHHQPGDQPDADTHGEHQLRRIHRRTRLPDPAGAQRPRQPGHAGQAGRRSAHGPGRLPRPLSSGRHAAVRHAAGTSAPQSVTAATHHGQL